MKTIGLLNYEVKGLEHIQKNNAQLIIANHPSLLDVVFLIAILEDCNCIVKQSLLRNPFTRPPVKAAQFITNESADLVGDCVQSLKKKEKLIIFPEGTRSIPGQPLKLMRGAANIALAANIDITPVEIRCEPATLLKNQKWYQVPEKPPLFSFHFFAPIKIDEITQADAMTSKKARQATEHIKQFFETRLGLSGTSH